MEHAFRCQPAREKKRAEAQPASTEVARPRRWFKPKTESKDPVSPEVANPNR